MNFGCVSLPKLGVKEVRELSVGDSLVVRPGGGKNPNASIKSTASKEKVGLTTQKCYVVVPDDDEMYHAILVTRVW